MAGNKLSQRINVDLDLGQARQQFRWLKAQMESITGPRGFSYNLSQGITNEIMESTKYATLLRTQLAQATNPLTGNLNLTKFNDQLRLSGTNLLEYQKQLSALGAAGNQAFNSLASSIASAETPLLRTSQAAQQMWTALGNTVRWQATSSLVHGVMSTAASAMNYVRNLDSSLNDIRIVTGQTQEQMTRFATQANQAAKALNTTTNNYAKAALIYYQQGLSNQQVEERTETTIKLANVSGQSAKKVSDQMTAVWNNFYDGSKSLEYYADVITALGASTASSSEEIAKGLSKFSSIAQTTGLSYEYATSALSTVVAATRQSADAVGTTFKTLFSRLQGLSLGDTLDDGVTLNKYSKALNTIGINVLNANGSLKDMDSILDELGSKWQTLSQAQQVALSQTIGGVRSYTGLMSLMDNWDDFQKNLATAQNSQGTLNAQARIYSESWEAASAHVRAASETIYSNLLSDKFFKGMTNGFGTLLDGVGAFTTGLGGVSGTLLQLGGIASRVFNNQIANGIENTALNLRGILYGQQDVIDIKRQASEALRAPVTFSRYDEVNKLQESYNRALDQRQIQYDQLMKQGKIPSYLQPVYQSMFNASDAQAQAVVRQAEDYFSAVEANSFNQMTANQSLFYNTSQYGKDSHQNIINEIKQAAQSGAIGKEWGSDIKAEEYYNRYVNSINNPTAMGIANASLMRTEAENAIPGIKSQFQYEQKYGFNGISGSGVIGAFNKDLNAYERAFERQVLANDLKTTAGSNLAQGLDMTQEQANRTAASITKVAAGFKQFGYTLDGSLKPLQETSDQIETLTSQYNSGKISLESYNNSIKDLIQKQMGESQSGQPATIGDLIAKYTAESYNGLQSLKDSMIETYLGGQGLTKSSATEEQLAEARSYVESRVGGLEALTKGKINLAAQTGGQNKTAAETLRALTNPELNKNIIGLGQGLTTLSGAAASVGSSIVSFANTLKVFGDESATAGQKATAMVSSLGTLPMALYNSGKLINSFGDHLKVFGTETALTMGGLTAATAGIAAAAVAAGIIMKTQEQGSEETALRNFTTATSVAAQKTSEAEQKAEQLSILEDSHNQLLSNLTNTQKGTLENTKALLLANQSANNIIEQYGLQYGEHYIYGQNGEIIFDPVKMQEVQENANNAAMQAMYDESYIRATQSLLAARQEYNELNKDAEKAWTEKTIQGLDDTKYSIASLVSEYEYSQRQAALGEFGYSFGTFTDWITNKDNRFNEQTLAAFLEATGLSSNNVNDVVGQLVKSYNSGTEEYDSSLLNKLFSNANNESFLKQYSAAQEILQTAGVQLKAAGLQTDLAIAYLSSDKQGLIDRQATLATLASTASEDTFMEKLFKNLPNVSTVKEYYEKIMKKDAAGLTEDQIKEEVIARIVETTNIKGAEGLKDLVGGTLFDQTFKELLGDFQGVEDVIETTKSLGISNLNNFKGLKVSDVNKELTTLQDKIKEYEHHLEVAGPALSEQGRQRMEEELSVMKSYNEAVQSQTASMVHGVIESFGQNLSKEVLKGDNNPAIAAYEALAGKYSLNELQSIAGYITQGNVFYGQNTADALYNAFLTKDSSQVFNAINKIDWSTSLSSLADLSKYANKAGEATELFSDLLNNAIKDIGGEGGIFQQLYNSSEFSKVLNKLEGIYQTNGHITAADILKYSEKSQELYDYLQIGKNSDQVNINAGGLAATLNAIGAGDITSGQVTSGLVSALSLANQRETIESEAFDIVKNQDLGESGASLVHFAQNLGKAFYTAKTNNLTMDDPLMAAIDLMPTYYQDIFYEGLRNGAYKSFSDIMGDSRLKPMVDFLTTMGGTGKYKGKGGGYFTDIINFFGEEFNTTKDLSVENGNFLYDYLAEKGIVWDNNNFGIKEGFTYTTTQFRDTLQEALSKIMTEEAAHQWATIFTEYGSNTSLGMQFGMADTNEAFQALWDAANQGQYANTGEGNEETWAGLHYYNEAELQAFYNQRKQYLDKDIYGSNFESFVSKVLERSDGRNAQLLAKFDFSKQDLNLSEATLNALIDSNKQLADKYGIETEKTFDNISSLLYAYGAISDNGYLDINRFSDFITASGGSAEIASKLLSGTFSEGYWGDTTFGAVLRDKLGNEFSVLRGDESYDDFMKRVNQTQSELEKEKYWIQDGKDEFGGHYTDIDSEGRILSYMLESDNYGYDAEKGIWVTREGIGPDEDFDKYLNAKNQYFQPGNLGDNTGNTANAGETPPGGGTTPPDSGETTSTTTTSTYTGSTPPSGKYSNWSTEAEQNAALNEFGGYDAATAKAQEAGFGTGMRGIMDYYAYTHPGKLSNWELTADQVAFADKKAYNSKYESADKRYSGRMAAQQASVNRGLEAKAAAKAQALRDQQAAEAAARDKAFLEEQAKQADQMAAEMAAEDTELAKFLKDQENEREANATAQMVQDLIDQGYYESTAWAIVEGKVTKEEVDNAAAVTAARQKAKEEERRQAEADRTEKQENYEAEVRNRSDMAQKFAEDHGISKAEAAQFLDKNGWDKETADTVFDEYYKNKQEEDFLAEQARIAEEEAARKAEEAKQEEEARQAEEAKRAEEAKTITSDEAAEKARQAILEGADAEVIDYYQDLAKNKAAEEKKAAEQKFKEEQKAAEDALKAEQETYIEKNQEAYESYQRHVEELGGEGSFEDFVKWNDTYQVQERIDQEKAVAQTTENSNQIQDLNARNAAIETELGNTADADRAQQLIDEQKSNQKIIDELTYQNSAIAYNQTWTAEQRTSAVQAAIDKANSGGELSSFERTLIGMLSDIGDDVGLQADIAKEASEEADKTGTKKAASYDAETGKMYDEDGNEITMPYEQPSSSQNGSPGGGGGNDGSGNGGNGGNNNGGNGNGGNGNGGDNKSGPDTDVTKGFTEVGYGYETGKGNYTIYKDESDGTEYRIYDDDGHAEFANPNDAKQNDIGNAINDLKTGNATGQNNTRILQFASGKEGHMAVTGELGPELTIREDGSIDMLGQHGREYTWVNPKDIIYTAAQTASIMGNNNIEWLDEFAKGFNNKIRGYDWGKDGTRTSSSASDFNLAGNTDNPGGVNSGGLAGAVQKGAYAGSRAGVGAGMAEAAEEEKDPRYDPNTLKERDILTRYFTILQQIDDITREVDKWAKTADRAWGEERVTAIHQQTEAYKDQLNAWLQYQREVEGYLQSDKDALTLMMEEFAEAFHLKTSTEIFGGESSQQSVRSTINFNIVSGGRYDKKVDYVTGAWQAATGQNNIIKPHAHGWISSAGSSGASGTDAAGDPALRTPINWTGAEYDKNGVLTNYRELIKAMLEIYNENAELFAQDKEAQYKFQEMLKDIQMYTDTLNLYEQNQQTLIDLRRTILDNQIREIVYKISFEDELDMNRLREINYQFGKIKDSAYDAADRIGYYSTQLDYLDKSNKRIINGLKDSLAAFSGNIRNGLEKKFNFKFYRKAPMEGYLGIDEDSTEAMMSNGMFMDIDTTGGAAYAVKEALRIKDGSIATNVLSSNGSLNISGLTAEEKKKLKIDYIDDETGFIYLNDGSWIDPKKRKRYRKKKSTGAEGAIASDGSMVAGASGFVTKAISTVNYSDGGFSIKPNAEEENTYTDEYGIKHKGKKEKIEDSSPTSEIGRLLTYSGFSGNNLYTEEQILGKIGGGRPATINADGTVTSSDGKGIVTHIKDGKIYSEYVNGDALKDAITNAFSNIPDNAKIISRTNSSVGYVLDENQSAGSLLNSIGGQSANKQLYKEQDILRSAGGTSSGGNGITTGLPTGDGKGIITRFVNGRVYTEHVDGNALRNYIANNSLQVPEGAKITSQGPGYVGYLADDNVQKPDILRLPSGEKVAIGAGGPYVIGGMAKQPGTSFPTGPVIAMGPGGSSYRLTDVDMGGNSIGDLGSFGLGSEGDEIEELPYFPTEYEINEYMKNFKKVKIGEETYYMPISDDVEIRDDITPGIALDQVILNNQGALTNDMKEIVTQQVQTWYDELVKLHPQLAVDIVPEYDKNGFMTNYREVMEKINEANAKMSEEAYNLLLTDPKAFFEMFSEITDKNMNFEDVTADLAMTIEKWMDGLYSNINSAKSYTKSAIDELSSYIKQTYKDVQDEIQEYDFLGEVITSYKNIIDLTNRQMTNIDKALIQSLSDSSFKNALNKINGAKAAYEEEKKRYEATKKEFDDKKDKLDQSILELQDKGLTLEQMKQNYGYSMIHGVVEDLESGSLKLSKGKFEETAKDLLKYWEDALEAAFNKYNTAMDEAARIFDQSFDPLLSSIDAFMTLVDKERALEDLYLDDYDRIHDLSALDRSIDLAILDTDNLKSKARLRDLQKEINDLQDKGVKLSSYDLEILNKKYQIELARQALEDAKNSKSVVRLSRDNNGNWSYAYSSNDIDIEAAEQNYEDSIRDIERLNQDYVKNIQLQIAQITAKAQQEIAAITPDSYNGDTETQDRMRAAILDNTRQQLDFIEAQMQAAFGNNGWLNPFIEDIYGTNNHNLYDEFIDTTIGKISGFDSLHALVQNSKDLIEGYNAETASYTKELYNDQKAVYDMVGVDIETAADFFAEQLEFVNETSDKTIDKINEVIEHVDFEFDRLIEKLDELLGEVLSDDFIKQIIEIETLNHNLNDFLEESAYYEPEQRLDFASAVDTYEELEAVKQGLAKYGKLLVTDFDEEGTQHFYHLAEGAASTAEQLTKWYDAAAKADTIDVGEDLDEREEYDKINKYLEAHGQVYISIDGELKKLSKDNADDMAWMQEKLKAIEEAENKANETVASIGKYLESGGGGKNYDEPYYHSNGDGTSTVYPYYGAENPVGTWNSNNGTYTPLDTGGYTGRWQGIVYADTGMYTGEWDGGSARRNGRLAWLHQKELVLNAHDTENFLDAMNIVRQLDNLTSWMANGLGDLFSPNVTTEEGTLQQEVHIDASFPNVTDHNEIEEAFGNLVNLASQYANRKAFA